MQSCCFIGHKDCTKREIEERLYLVIENLILKEHICRFYVGVQGGFDRIVYETLCDLEKNYEMKIIVVLDYLNRAPMNPYYNMQKTIFPEVLEKTPLKYAIRKKNSFMIDESDWVVCYVNDKLSNAYKNIEEAIKKKKKIINLGKLNIFE